MKAAHESARKRAARIVLDGIKQQVPDISPTDLRLLFAAAVTLREQEWAELQAQREQEAVAAAVARVPSEPEHDPEEEARMRLQNALHARPKRNGRGKRYPKLQEECATLYRSNPDLTAMEAYAYFERKHGHGFLSESAFKDGYWYPVRRRAALD